MNFRRSILFSAGALVGLSLLTASALGELVIHYDVSDSSTVVDTGGANPGDGGFNRRVETIMDKAGGDHNGTQNGGVLGYNANGDPALFNGNPYVTTDGSNYIGFDDPTIDNITWVGVFQSDVVGATNSIGQMPVAGGGAIMYQRTLDTAVDQGGNITRPSQLMVGIRGGKEFLSLDDMFDGGPTIMSWTYGGGPTDPSGIGDPSSLQFYKNGARWGPVETCCGIGGSAADGRIGGEAGPPIPGVNWAEIRIYDEVLSNADRRAVFGELGEKYGIVPEPHALLLLAIGAMGLPLLRRWFR